MTIARVDDRIVLTGTCPIEEAEQLLTMMQELWASGIVLEGCGRLSTAVVQVLLASSLPVTGMPADAFTRDLVLPSLLQARAAGAFGVNATIA